MKLKLEELKKDLHITERQKQRIEKICKNYNSKYVKIDTVDDFIKIYLKNKLNGRQYSLEKVIYLHEKALNLIEN